MEDRNMEPVSEWSDGELLEHAILLRSSIRLKEKRLDKILEHLDSLEDISEDEDAELELRNLIDEWRHVDGSQARQQGAYQVADTFEKCADELEEVLDDE